MGGAEPAVTLVTATVSVGGGGGGAAAASPGVPVTTLRGGEPEKRREKKTGGKEAGPRPLVCSCACPDPADRQVCQVCCGPRRGHARAATLAPHNKSVRVQKDAVGLFFWLFCLRRLAAAAKNSHPCTGGELQPPLGIQPPLTHTHR